MKTTAFHKYHVEAGAKMAEFAGYVRARASST